MSDALRISETFPGYSHQDWQAVAEKALKGAPLSRISTKTEDGVAVDPIYSRKEGKAPLAMRDAQTPWAICQKVDHPDAAKANEQALIDLSNGTNMLSIPFAGSAPARGFGLDASKEAIATALKDVLLDLIKIRLEGGVTGRVAASAFADVVKERGFDPAGLDVSFGLDPIGTFASHGIMAPDWAGRTNQMLDAIKALKEQGFKGPFITVDGRPYHDAGASDGQELGAVLASVLTYWRVLEEAGYEAAEALSMIDVTLSVEADQFGSLAKIRAMRHLWARMLEAANVPFLPLTIHAETSWAMMTRLDPWVNILRVTTASFAAGVGGADSVCILPHTAAIGLPDTLARRISRNLQTLLLEESNLYQVTDPAAGSGYVESLTSEIAQRAWARFQQIEQAGGMIEALTSGVIAGWIDESNEARGKLIASRKNALTGASAFPDIHEDAVAVEAVEPVAAPSFAKQGVTCRALTAQRLAEPYEALRDAASSASKAPSVFFANLGRIADYTARSTWAKNFFEAGGVAALSDQGFDNAQSAIDAFKQSGAEIACLVGPDGLYEDMADQIASGLKEAGAKMVYLAGRPKELMEALSAAGVDAYAFEGCDVLAELTKIHAILGIKPAAQA
ncbi:MAG: methylmalonyl-CoA mutase family protein [Cohaesibacter sp.]|jgi:methylmalonyl-CoA mutase|nr:methylmalonyl-CoA mutase family protein [Cohaesibacter sp.]